MRSFETGYLGNYIHDFSHNSQKIEVKKTTQTIKVLKLQKMHPQAQIEKFKQLPNFVSLKRDKLTKRVITNIQKG